MRNIQRRVIVGKKGMKERTEKRRCIRTKGGGIEGKKGNGGKEGRGAWPLNHGKKQKNNTNRRNEEKIIKPGVPRPE